MLLVDDLTEAMQAGFDLWLGPVRAFADCIGDETFPRRRSKRTF